MSDFDLQAPFEPAGDQPRAIESLAEGYRKGHEAQTLLGVTGSGKTFTMAHVIQELGVPTLVMSHNKTLAAQLYVELRDFFPNNAVGYFVSYYDYYQPEAYMPNVDVYIEKETSVNEDLDRLRLHATSSLLTRNDVVIVASVSCIYGLGSPEDYKSMMIHVKEGDTIDRDDFLRNLVDMQYDRNDYSFTRGHFRVRGDVVEVIPSYEELAVRIEFWGDEVDRIQQLDSMTGEIISDLQSVTIFPAKHFVTPEEKLQAASGLIEDELDERLEAFNKDGKLLEAQRLEARTRYDLEMLMEVGFCPGIENYSRFLSGRDEGQPPYTLYDYFPDDYLLIIDESHVSIPQIRGMYAGDRSRKLNLVDHGFRLPSALDNRPLRFDEWEERNKRILYVSATPDDYEIDRSQGRIVEQIIRPTGLVDPTIEVRSADGQLRDLMKEIAARAEVEERVLVTTLTKRMAEELSMFIEEEGLRGQYLHSEIDALDRVQVLRDLREGKFDVLVGVNLLREGLDLPEVSLVAILDADKEGFLRNYKSLIQTIGRTARNVNAHVILYGDRVTPSMRDAMNETARRRRLQLRHNEKHGIEPETIKKEIKAGIEAEVKGRSFAQEAVHENEEEYVTAEVIRELEVEMFEAAKNLEFERAAELRDRIQKIQGKETTPPKTEYKKTLRGKRRGRMQRESE
ncbi:MAG: excinuclease ABC subunit UvrB [Planctomycetota bacterium]|nr:excinuclease ABC subunit UvrB [Planctomycetota bacterium]MDP7253094.1 excinuclease ABC subunit UvrB [Planctomycetota bacterium]